MSKCHVEWGYSTLKSAKPGKRSVVVAIWWYCELIQCEWCPRMGPPWRVRAWWYRGYWDRDYDRHEPTICMACFNRIRPLWRAERDAWELGALCRKLQREISNARRGQDDRRTSLAAAGNN